MKSKNPIVQNALAHHNFKVGDYVGMRGVHPSADAKMRVTKVDGDKIYTDGDSSPWTPKELQHWDNNYHKKFVYNALSDYDAGVKDCKAGYYDKWYRWNKKDNGAEYDRGYKAQMAKGGNPPQRIIEATHGTYTSHELKAFETVIKIIDSSSLIKSIENIPGGNLGHLLRPELEGLRMAMKRIRDKASKELKS